MKLFIACLLLLLSPIAQAQVSTSFTLGGEVSNYLTVTTQDDFQFVPYWTNYYVFDCALTSYYCRGLQSSINIVLPDDPTNPGYNLGLTCQGSNQVSTVTLGQRSTAQQPPGYIESTEVCRKYNGVSGVWTGTLTYNYNSVYQQRCSGGHPVCYRGYWYVYVGGSGELTLQ